MTYKHAKNIVLQNSEAGFFAIEKEQLEQEGIYYLQGLGGQLYITKSCCTMRYGKTPEDNTISLLEEDIDEQHHYNLLNSLDWFKMEN